MTNNPLEPDKPSITITDNGSTVIIGPYPIKSEEVPPIFEHGIPLTPNPDGTFSDINITIANPDNIPLRRFVYQTKYALVFRDDSEVIFNTLEEAHTYLSLLNAENVEIYPLIERVEVTDSINPGEKS